MLFLMIIPYVFTFLHNPVYGEEALKKSVLPENCGFIDRDRVTNTKYAGLYEFPWMALISRIADDGGHQYLCTGTVINEWYILTTSACVENTRASLVRVGDYDKEQEVDCEGQGPTLLCEDQFQDISIDKVIVYKGADSKLEPNVGNFSGILHDVALVRLKTPIDFSQKNAAPICLPTTIESQKELQPNQDAVIAGWELIVNGQTSSKMLKTKLPVRDNIECTKNGFESETNNNTKEFGLCTGGMEGVCPMISGSPLMVATRSSIKNDELRYVQYGISSYGTFGCGSDQWTVYTDVIKHMDWILNKLKTEDELMR